MKKAKQILLLVAMVVLVLGCNKDDAPKMVDPDPIGNPDPEPEPENRAPGSFSLLSVTNNATDVDVLPTFSWEVATDPDGDAVSYDLYIGQAADSTKLIAADLGTTSFEVSERLVLTTDYYWQVVAKDGQGKETSSATYHFTTRDLIMPERPLVSGYELFKRNGYTLTVFKDMLWLIGGTKANNNGPILLNDVWFSTDGINWSLATGEINFPPRAYHSAEVFDDKLWVIGGFSGAGGRFNDVWFSENGADWYPATRGAEFSPRMAHASVVYDNKLWVIGGDYWIDNENRGLENDVWFSDNGKFWQLANNNPPFAERSAPSLTVFENELWLIGGSISFGKYTNEIWKSTNGVIWVPVFKDGNGPFSKKAWHSSFIFENRLWVIGGFGRNDAWYSKDGVHWDSLFDDLYTSFSSTSVVFKDKLWIFDESGQIWKID